MLKTNMIVEVQRFLYFVEMSANNSIKWSGVTFDFVPHQIIN